jgi:hypothetical protein
MTPARGAWRRAARYHQVRREPAMNGPSAINRHRDFFLHGCCQTRLFAPRSAIGDRRAEPGRAADRMLIVDDEPDFSQSGLASREPSSSLGVTGSAAG